MRERRRARAKTGARGERWTWTHGEHKNLLFPLSYWSVFVAPLSSSCPSLCLSPSHLPPCLLSLFFRPYSPTSFSLRPNFFSFRRLHSPSLYNALSLFCLKILLFLNFPRPLACVIAHICISFVIPSLRMLYFFPFLS